MSLRAEKKRLSKSDLKRIHERRSKRARQVDESLPAPMPPTLKDWKKHPDRYDVAGVDYPKTPVPEYTTESVKPVVKWVGGKRQIEDVIYELSPKEFEQYWEPFSGGAAIFFKLIREGKIDAAVVSDYNPQLSITYATLADDVESVIAHLESKEFENTEKNYYKVRGWDRRKNWEAWMRDRENWPRVAARVIFLTKLSFNGLWRENSKGQHNAPYCKVPDKATFDRKNLYAVSKELKGVTIGQASYQYLKKENWDVLAQNYMPPTPTDFIYFDPPYVTTFTDYTSAGFGWENLRELKQITDDLSSIGAYTMVSHTDHPKIRKLWKGYRFIEIKTHARISRDPTKRKHAMSEVIIMNYDENGNILSSISPEGRSQNLGTRGLADNNES